MWVDSTAPIILEPLHGLAESIITAAGAPRDARAYYDKRAWESIYLVNTDGNVYSYANAFDVPMSHGNIFQSPMRDLVGGAGHLRVVEAAEARVKSICSDCRHHGRYCSGYPVAEENFGKMGADAATCIRERGVLDHIERRLHELGVLNSDGKLNSQSKYITRFHPALMMPA
jgi:uncharacterized protein